VLRTPAAYTNQHYRRIVQHNIACAGYTTWEAEVGLSDLLRTYAPRGPRSAFTIAIPGIDFITLKPSGGNKGLSNLVPALFCCPKLVVAAIRAAAAGVLL
jgi:hypothetical protein